MRKLAILFVSITIFSFVNAQDEPIEFGKVSIPDILMKSYEPEPEAEAVVLAHTARLYISSDRSYQMNYDYFKRIKILDESAFDLADQELLFYSKDGYRSIYGLKAVITYPNGKTYELGKDDFFKEDINDEYTRIKFTYPKLQVGSVLDYKYTLIVRNISFIDDFYFQENIPVRYAEIKYPPAGKFAYTFLAQNPQYIKRKDDKLFMDSIPSMKAESFITTMEDYRGRIKTQLNAYRDYGGYTQKILSSWEQVISDLRSHLNFGKEYLKRSKHNEILESAESILSSNAPIKTKILQLQEFILNNVKWNGEYRIYSEEGLEDVWEEGEGNSSEMNLIMITLLRAIDIEAYPLLISTRDHGKVLREYPFLTQFSHTLVYCLVDNEPLLIDVSEKYRPPGIVSFQSCNGDGLIIKKKEPEWCSVTGNLGTDSFLGQFTIKGDTLSGKIKAKYRGYAAVPERGRFENKGSEKNWENRLRAKFSEAEVTYLENNIDDGIYEDYREELDIEIPEAIFYNSDFIYIDPFLYSNYTENPFKQENRDYPIDFGRPFSEIYVFNIEIPEGYTVEEVPETGVISMKDKQTKYTFSSTVQGNKISIISRLTIGKTKYEPNEYSALKQLFNLMIEKTGTNIVLKKI